MPSRHRRSVRKRRNSSASSSSSSTSESSSDLSSSAATTNDSKKEKDEYKNLFPSSSDEDDLPIEKLVSKEKQQKQHQSKQTKTKKNSTTTSNSGGNRKGSNPEQQEEPKEVTKAAATTSTRSSSRRRKPPPVFSPEEEEAKTRAKRRALKEERRSARTPPPGNESKKRPHRTKDPSAPQSATLETTTQKKNRPNDENDQPQQQEDVDSGKEEKEKTGEQEQALQQQKTVSQKDSRKAEPLDWNDVLPEKDVMETTRTTTSQVPKNESNSMPTVKERDHTDDETNTESAKVNRKRKTPTPETTNDVTDGKNEFPSQSPKVVNKKDNGSEKEPTESVVQKDEDNGSEKEQTELVLVSATLPEPHANATDTATINLDTRNETTTTHETRDDGLDDINDATLPNPKDDKCAIESLSTEPPKKQNGDQPPSKRKRTDDAAMVEIASSSKDDPELELPAPDVKSGEAAPRKSLDKNDLETLETNDTVMEHSEVLTKISRNNHKDEADVDHANSIEKVDMATEKGKEEPLDVSQPTLDDTEKTLEPTVTAQKDIPSLAKETEANILPKMDEENPEKIVSEENATTDSNNKETEQEVADKDVLQSIESKSLLSTDVVENKEKEGDKTEQYSQKQSALPGGNEHNSTDESTENSGIMAMEFEQNVTVSTEDVKNVVLVENKEDAMEVDHIVDNPDLKPIHGNMEQINVKPCDQDTSITESSTGMAKDAPASASASDVKPDAILITDQEKMEHSNSLTDLSGALESSDKRQAYAGYRTLQTVEPQVTQSFRNGSPRPCTFGSAANTDDQPEPLQSDNQIAQKIHEADFSPSPKGEFNNSTHFVQEALTLEIPTSSAEMDSKSRVADNSVSETAQNRSCAIHPAVDKSQFHEKPPRFTFCDLERRVDGRDVIVSRTNLERVKCALYSLGSRVHRSRGYEKLFADYWNSLTICINLKGSRSIVERARVVINSFLRTKTMRRLHNKLIFGILERCIDPVTPLCDIPRFLPPSIEQRIRVVSESRQTSEEQKVHCLTKDKESDSILGYTPLCAEIESITCDRFISPDGLSASIPGAIVVDPYVRRLAESAGMDVTENAVWLLTIAIKEYTKYLLENSIYRRKEIDDGKVPPPPITSLKVQNKKSQSDVGSSRQQSLPHTVPPSRRITSNDIHGLISFMPNSGGRSLSGCISRGTFERTLFSTYESSVVRGEEAFQTVNKFFLSSLLDHLSKDAGEESPGPVPSLPQSEELGDGDSNAHSPSPTAIRQSLPSSSLDIVETTNDAPSQPKTIEPKEAFRVRDFSTSRPEISSETIPIDGVPSPMSIEQAKDSTQTSLPITELATSLESQPLEAPPPLSIAQPEVKPRPVTVRGLGRGAKNLASLKARTSQTGIEGSTPDTRTEANSTKEDTTSAQISDETSLNETQDKSPISMSEELQSSTQDKAFLSDAEQVEPSTDGNPEASEKQLTQTIVPRGRGKGFGVKNLAAMRARSFTLRSECGSFADDDGPAGDLEVENGGKEFMEAKTEIDNAECGSSSTREELKASAVEARVPVQSTNEGEAISSGTIETSTTTQATTEVTCSNEVDVQMENDETKDDVAAVKEREVRTREESSVSKDDTLAPSTMIEASLLTGDVSKTILEKNVEAKVRMSLAETAENVGDHKDSVEESVVAETMARGSKELTLDVDKVHLEADDPKQQPCEMVTESGERETKKVESHAEVEQGDRPLPNGENATQETELLSVRMEDVEDKAVPAQDHASRAVPEDEADIVTKDENAGNKVGFLSRVSEAFLTYVGGSGNDTADILTKAAEQPTPSAEGVPSLEESPSDEKGDKHAVIVGDEQSTVAVDAAQATQDFLESKE